MTKAELRANSIEFLKGISKEDRYITEKKLKDQLISSSIWEQATTIGLTVSQAMEWDTKPIIEEAWKAGKTVCVPKCSPKEKMLTFYKLESFNQLEVVYYNLLEPNPTVTQSVAKMEIQLLLVPGLVFDKRGYRIGFGGGYYDRYLADYPNVTASLLHSEQLVDQVPAESFDIPVQHIITAEKSW
ncbi:5-formyltetrahydrofolate cyclo-ligase family protein [Oceanobacillus picturae]|uniref:5-formyltetrahydrofolate cyclo-ligase n=1 Tax=Oceanobacillus picturae TaxID=171693 RepID=A0A0U9HDA8_9BACI|nr:5-formyltetrahydrofolate cyclo-ligase [Oceanobacillus picturae]GAQ19801.1 5-formyltetrahydrofolate cyclo-ligase family protein [Oceanobacillus picturae]